jgi:hypothetical protein
MAVKIQCDVCKAEVEAFVSGFRWIARNNSTAKLDVDLPPGWDRIWHPYYEGLHCDRCISCGMSQQMVERYEQDNCYTMDVPIDRDLKERVGECLKELKSQSSVV